MLGKASAWPVFRHRVLLVRSCKEKRENEDVDWKQGSVTLISKMAVATLDRRTKLSRQSVLKKRYRKTKPTTFK